MRFSKCIIYIQKDRLQRRRPGLDNRLKDDHGNRREHDRIERINDERFDRADNSPSHDRQSKGGGLEAGNLDESMYDTYGGKDLGVIPPFPSDMAPPPPFLMPVPGAGWVPIFLYIFNLIGRTVF